MVARNVQAYDAAQILPLPVFFDRGVPECLGHMRFLGLDVDRSHVAQSVTRRYADTVFVAEPWPEIYVRDRWRQAPFERAERSFMPTVAPYVEAGYATCMLPKVSVEERVAFVLEKVRQAANSKSDSGK